MSSKSGKLGQDVVEVQIKFVDDYVPPLSQSGVTRSPAFSFTSSRAELDLGNPGGNGLDSLVNQIGQNLGPKLSEISPPMQPPELMS